MQNPKIFKAAALAFFMCAAGLLAPIAHAQTGPGTASGGMKGDMNKPAPMMGSGMGGQPMMAGGMDMKTMMTDMNNKMLAMKSTGNTDVDFAMMMRVHHQSAITMAEAELQNGKDPQMRVMAKDIIRAQKKEIAAFDKFLAKRGVADMKMSEPGMPMKK